AQNLAAGLVISLFLLVALALLIPSLAVSIRRLHDSDKSGLWLLLHFAPFGGVVLLIFMLLDGTPGSNRFGPDPKARQPYGGPNVVHHHHHYAAETPAETPTT
ncbi:MAG: DUF805 domain-containing protein, partial [Caulobacter sp.]|nr:DUF805 domain-containing protein [Caulobacter sp.]